MRGRAADTYSVAGKDLENKTVYGTRSITRRSPGGIDAFHFEMAHSNLINLHLVVSVYQSSRVVFSIIKKLISNKQIRVAS